MRFAPGAALAEADISKLPGLSSVDGLVVILQTQMQHTLVTVHIVVAILDPDGPPVLRRCALGGCVSRCFLRRTLGQGLASP